MNVLHEAAERLTLTADVLDKRLTDDLAHLISECQTALHAVLTELTPADGAAAEIAEYADDIRDIIGENEADTGAAYVAERIAAARTLADRIDAGLQAADILHREIADTL